MDAILHPEKRKWISPECHLGNQFIQLAKAKQLMFANLSFQSRKDFEEMNEEQHDQVEERIKSGSVDPESVKKQAEYYDKMFGGDKFFNVKLKDTLRTAVVDEDTEDAEDEEQALVQRLDNSLGLLEKDLSEDESDDMQFELQELVSGHDLKEAKFDDFDGLQDVSNPEFRKYLTKLWLKHQNLWTDDMENSSDEEADNTEVEQYEFEWNPQSGEASFELNESNRIRKSRSELAEELDKLEGEGPVPTAEELKKIELEDQLRAKIFDPFNERVYQGKLKEAPLEFMKLALKKSLRKRFISLGAKMTEDTKQFDDLFESAFNSINWAATTVRGETHVDDAVLINGKMPPLAPYLPNGEKKRFSSLCVLALHGEDPEAYQWRSPNVQQQINDNIEASRFQKKMEIRSSVLPTVDADKDFVLEGIFFHKIDSEKALPDELKLSRPQDCLRKDANSSRRKEVPELSGKYQEPSSAQAGMTRSVEPKENFTFQILGSNTVKQLRDLFVCENDKIYLNDVEHPDDLKKEDFKPVFAGDVYDESILCIGETIFRDSSVAGESNNYAEKLNRWALDPPRKEIGPFTDKSMQETKIRDLVCRFGTPYSFMHMEDCEHIFVFNSARLLSADDSLQSSDYPNRLGNFNSKIIYCRIDNGHVARWAVMGYENFPEDPMFICTECLLDYCYLKNKKNGTFKLYPLRQLACE